MREKRLHVNEHASALLSGKLSGSIWQTDAQPEPALESLAEAGACALGSSLGSGLCWLGREGSAGS